MPNLLLESEKIENKKQSHTKFIVIYPKCKR